MTDEKNTSELWKFYLNGKLDELNSDEIVKLQGLIKKHGALQKVTEIETIVEPEDKMNLDNSERKYTGDGDNAELILWAKNINAEDYENMFINTDADASCPTDYSDWTPTEFYSQFILHAVAADTPLIDLVKMKVNVGAGNGDTVRFRHINSRSAQVVGSGECMSCCSSSITKTDVTIARYGDYTVLNQFELWQSKDVKEAVVKSMGIGASRYVNAEIHDAITEAAPGYDVDMAAVFTDTTSLVGSCCTMPDATNFYKSCVDLVANMTAAGYTDLKKNGCWLIHPTVCALLKFSNGVDVPFWMRGSTDVQNGELVKLLGIECREDPLGQTLTTAGATVFAYLINKQRSIGMAWGQKPKFTYDYSGICDAWDITYNAYFGVDSIEDQSIGTVSSP